MSKEWNLVHSLGAEAKWTDGFRAEFQYRDLGIEAGTKGAFTAHLVKAKPGVEDAVREAEGAIKRIGSGDHEVRLGTIRVRPLRGAVLGER